MGMSSKIFCVLLFFFFMPFHIWDWLMASVFLLCLISWWSLKKDLMGIFFFFFSLLILWYTLKQFPLGSEYLFLGLLLCLYICFFSYHMMWFFMFFELALMPLFFLMLKFGSTPERMKASWGIVLYTVGGSLPFLFNIMDFGNLSHSWYIYSDFSVLSFSFFLFWVIVFFVKMPIFGFHSWLPIAHGEAPTYGSMMLGAMMLKLGVMGLYRVLPFLNLLTNFWSFSLVISWMAFSFFISSLFALGNSDMKVIIAFSSIVHLSPVSISLFLGGSEGIFGVGLMGMGHGFSSSMLFLGMGGVYFIRGYRSSYFISMVKNKFFLGCWFLACVIKASLPPTVNFFSEMFMYYVFFSFSYMLGIICLPGAMLSGIYCLVLYTKICHGSSSRFVSLSQQNLYFFWSMVNHLVFSVMFMFLCFSF